MDDRKDVLPAGPAADGDVTVRLGSIEVPLARVLDARNLTGLRGGRSAFEPGLTDGSRAPAWWDTRSRGLRLVNQDLAGARLDQADLTGANLHGADLSGAIGRSTDFTEAVIEVARLTQADLNGATFRRVSAGEADFSDALLEDAKFIEAHLRYARLDRALLDGADFTEADLWGARLGQAEADNAVFRGARCDEADFSDADLSGTDFTGASLKKATLIKAKLRGATLDGAILDGAHLDGADLANASLPRLNLQTCSLKHVRLAGAWLDKTRLRPEQLGGAVGEDMAREYHAAREAYVALEQNFRSLGNGDAASWAFRKGRRMGKLHERETALHAWRGRHWRKATRHAVGWLSDAFVEWLCDYGESLGRVLRAFGTLTVVFAAFYGATESLVRIAGPAGDSRAVTENPFDLLTFSFLNMVSTSAPDIGLRPASAAFYLVTSLQGAVGIVLIGLFGYVLGNRMRR